jgi:diguanylate cyclase (GGDEF)-like protein
MAHPIPGAEPIVRELTRLRRAHDEEQLISLGLEAVTDILGARIVALHLDGGAGGRLIWRDPESAGLLFSEHRAPRDGSCLLSCRGRQDVVHMQEDPEDCLSNGSAVAAPLQYEGDELGALAVLDCDAPGELVLELARHIAFALLDLRERRKSARQADQLQNILQSTLVINSTLDLDNLLELLMDMAVEMSGADAGSLLLKEEAKEKLYFKVARGDSEEEIKAFSLEPGEGIAGWVAEFGAPVVVEDAHEDSRFSNKVDEALGQRTRAIICVPLKTKDEVIGALEVVRNRRTEPFDQSCVVLLSSLASQAAIAIKNAMLYRMAITDALTGLYSYRYFQDALKRESKLAEKNKSHISLVLLDVDRFKLFNDRHGHQVGDKVLQEIASVLHTSMRDTDVISRYGGEEMVIILRDTPKETAVKIAERVRAAVEALRVPGSHGEELQVTISLGVSTYPTDTLIRDRLFYLVDSALYAAKEGGRNRVVPFSEDLLADSIKIQ